MNNYYFTFGSSHITTNGVAMENYWIRVVATDYGTARHLFIEKFTMVRMEKPDKFAFQYEEDKFGDDERKLFIGGEYLVIGENAKPFRVVNTVGDNYNLEMDEGDDVIIVANVLGEQYANLFSLAPVIIEDLEKIVTNIPVQVLEDHPELSGAIMRSFENLRKAKWIEDQDEE